MMGLGVPVGVAPGGGALCIEGNEEDTKIVALALADSTNENPFQAAIGLGSEFVFDVADIAVENLIRTRIIDVFRLFKAQLRFELRAQTIAFLSVPGSNELICTFEYISTEANQERQFRQIFGASKPGSFNGQG